LYIFFVYKKEWFEMRLNRILREVFSVVLLACTANAAVSISVVGDGSGYDILGAGWASDEATAYRSTGVLKTFDVGGDNVYGTEGVFMFGDGFVINNHLPFSSHTQMGASWATFSPGAHWRNVATDSTQGPMDDPQKSISDTVSDFGVVGFCTGASRKAGNWGEMVTFATSDASPQQFRIGLVAGTQSASDGRWDPTGLRITADGGSTYATVTGLENNHGAGTFGFPNWVFFDVDLNGETWVTFSIEGQQRLSTQGPSLTGVTFDATPTSAPNHVIVRPGDGLAETPALSRLERLGFSFPSKDKADAGTAGTSKIENGRIEPLAVANKGMKPNIVFIMADDLGPGWVDFDGSHPEINTPNLERLAKSGMVFTKAYAAATVCSPTRAACITGMSPAQIGLTTHIPGKAGYERKAPRGGPRDAETLNHLPLELPSYARELKKLGYATGFLGKWHLAGEGSIKSKAGIVDERYHPEHFGFDSNIGGCAYGQPRSWFSPYHNATIKDGPKNEYLTDRMGSEAVSFIEANKDHPFHLALWFYSVHAPIQAPKDLVKKNGGNAYLAMLESMDHAVGKVLDTLEATGTLDNTLVIFYSDNGGDKPTSWLADKKGSLLEGGLRVPMAVSWPGVIRPGTQCAVPVISMDFFPTFVHAAGGTTKEITQLEGLDLLPLFQGLETLDRDALTWHYPHNRPDVKYYMGSSILQGDWKLYEGHGTIPDALFNLKDDPMETKNLLKQNPELADRLRGKLHTWLTSVNAKMPPRVK
jgi:arylsulfatase A-like enzyme